MSTLPGDGSRRVTAAARPAEPYTAPRRVAVSALVTSSLIRVDGVDAAHVARLAKSEEGFEPIVVHRRTMRVVDGVHRTLAARLRGDTHIAGVFIDGGETELLLSAVRLNSSQGLPLSRRDRRAVIARLVADHPSWSDRRLAQEVGVSAKTVGAVRRLAQALPSTEENPQSSGRWGADGRFRPLDGAPGRARVLQVLQHRPRALVREVAEAADVSMATVVDVRRRLARGDDPLGSSRPDASDRPNPPGTGRRGDDLPAVRLLGTLRGILRDPAMRSSQMGPVLVRLLGANLAAASRSDQLVAAVPSHRVEEIARIIRHQAQWWHLLANRLEAATTADLGSSGATTPRTGDKILP